eukprot:Phypoly_transcript_10127.p1 GENE.Phypoly_transcript_10127~~Phypoly_transcript_10127.p1  ORF type:complete len:359 (+),score=39.60 Phypoly_transcript_10127:124-1200(+)
MKLEELRTPAFLVYEHVVASNSQKMINDAQKRGLGMRPHMKTHKTIEAANFMLAGQKDGEKKIVVSTLAEVTFYKSHGIKDIVYAVPLALSKIPEVVAIAKEIKIHVFVDNFTVINAIVEYHKTHSGTPTWSCFLKVDCGNHRAGLEPDDPENLELAKTLAHGYPGVIDFQGIYAHAGQSYKSNTVEELRKHAELERDVVSQFVVTLKEKVNVECKVVSVGSTPTCSHLPENMGKITEIHPGNYVFYDWMNAELKTCKESDIACTVLARVVGHYPKRKQILIDAGALAFTSDLGCVHLHKFPQFGAVKGATELRVVAITQELGKIEHEGGEQINFAKFPIGSLIEVYPNHSCLTAAMF